MHHLHTWKGGGFLGFSNTKQKKLLEQFKDELYEIHEINPQYVADIIVYINKSVEAIHDTEKNFKKNIEIKGIISNKLDQLGYSLREDFFIIINQTLL